MAHSDGETSVGVHAEKRRMERFSIRLPATVCINAAGDSSKIMKLWTRNICAGGAYLETEEPLEVSTSVEINLVVHGPGGRHGSVGKAFVKVTGNVIRSNTKGMAIKFGRKYKISPASD